MPRSLLAIVILGAAGVIHAAETSRVQVLPLESTPAPQLDGKLDDPCWRLAPAVTHFTQTYPREGDLPSEKTEVRFAYDHRRLYIAIRCFESDPSRITARELQRDSFDEESFPADDFVQIILDPFGRERDGFLFAVNPLGTRTDGRIEQAGVTVVEWDGLWDARAVQDELGWSAEMEIPFSSLGFDPPRQAWGANIQRVIRRSEEIIRWVGAMEDREGDYLKDLAQLEGLKDLDQGLGYELKPYMVLRHLDPLGEDAGMEWRTGLDASWLITPALTATITINTDFAETEVDDRQVNLSRFPLFYPEKRDFFLRDAPYFSSPFASELLVPFFTRSIGRSDEGEPVDILGGVKVTGRSGPYTFGLLDVEQRGYFQVPEKNLLAARVTRELSDDLTLGMLVTNGDPYSQGGNTVAGADLTWRTNEFLGDKDLESAAYLLGSSGSGTGNDAAFGGNVYYPNLPWNLYGSFLQIGEDFYPALGFVERQGVREYNVEANYQIQVERWGLERVDWLAAPWTVSRLDGEVESAYHVLPEVIFSFAGGPTLEFSRNVKREQLFGPFEIQPGIEIAEGDYRFNTWQMEFGGAPSWIVSPSGGVEIGDFYDGHNRIYSLGMDIRPSPYVFLGLFAERYDIDLPAGDFTTDLLSARLKLALSPRLSWNTIAQYDNESDLLGFSSRIRWEVRPGTDIYLIANEGYLLEPGRNLRHLESETAVKAGVTWRF